MEIGLFWAFILVISIVCNGILMFGILHALRRVENYEGFFNAMQDQLTTTILTIREIDLRGAFESDDEVGGVFKQIHAIINALDVFLTSEGVGASDDSLGEVIDV